MNKMEKSRKQKMIKKTIIIIGIVVAVIILGIIILAVSPEVCVSDINCVKVDLDCCGCENGGNSIAVNKLYSNILDKSDDKKCEGMICFTMYNCLEGRVPKCVNNICKLTTG